MPDDSSKSSSDSLITTGDYSQVPVQIAPGGTDAVSRPTKGTALVWGGSDPSSPWGQLQSLIAKGGGSVSYLHIGAGDVAKSANAPTGAPGDAPVQGSDSAAGQTDQQSGPTRVEPTPSDAAPGLEHVSGPAGEGPLFDAGIDIGYQGEPTRIWAHPRAAHSGPRPLIVYLHGINPTGKEHPALSSDVGKPAGAWMHMGKIAQGLISDGKVTPLAMAAPTHSASAPWDKIDFEEFVNLCEAKFKEQGVELDLDQIAIVGHSGAGGYPGRGMNKLAEQNGMIGSHQVKVFGLADTRITTAAAASYKSGLASNDTTIVYSIHRGTGGWADDEYQANGGNGPFSNALGATNQNTDKMVGEEHFDTIEDYYDNDGESPWRVSIKVKQPMSAFLATWRAIGGYGQTDQGNHFNVVPRWTSWALPRFFAQTDADKTLLASMTAEPPKPPAPVPPPPPPPTSGVTGGEFNIPPAAKPWVNPAGEIPPKMLETFEFSPASSGIYYPVRAEKLPAGRGVYYIGEDGTGYGPGGRGCAAAGYFLANRSGGARKHVGIDMSINAFNAMVVACESGTIVNFYWFYENAWCLIVQCDSGLVINYGEVDADSLKDYKLKVGSRVVAGQPIGNIRKMDISAMLHFENYRSGTTANCNYYENPANAAETAKSNLARQRLYNPTQYVLNLAKNGK